MIYWVNLGDTVGSEQGGIRPFLVIQNDIGNKYSPTVIGFSMTTQSKRNLPTHIGISKDEYENLEKDSFILTEQVRTIDKSRIISEMEKLNYEDMKRVEHAAKISFGFITINTKIQTSPTHNMAFA